jgi:hypothetical protein
MLENLSAAPCETLSTDGHRWVPCEDPDGYPALNFKPFHLKTWFLIVTIIFFIGCGSSIAAVMHYSQDPSRLSLEAMFSQLSYQYVPGLVGSITFIWFQAITGAYGHIVPYMQLAQTSVKYHGVLNSAGSFAYFQPSFTQACLLLYNKEFAAFVFMLLPLFVQTIFIPLKTSFIFVMVKTDGSAALVVNRHIGLLLIVAYAVFTTFTFTVCWKVHNKRTGLRWDPTTIADQLSLLHGSSLGSIFQGVEYLEAEQAMHALKRYHRVTGSLRFGYGKCDQCDKCVNTGVIRYGLDFVDPQAVVKLGALSPV